MSIEALNWSLAQKAPDHTSKLVLMMLANLSDPDGFSFPSVSYLAIKCQLSRRTIINKLDMLVEAGLLNKETRKHEDGSYRSSQYRLPLEGGSAESARGSADDGNAHLYISTLSTPKTKRATQFPYTEIPEHWIRVCNEKRPDLDPHKLFEIMQTWCEANEKTYKDWDAAWRNWLMKEQKHAKPNGSRKESRDERLAREQREYADTAEGRAALAALERLGLGL